MSSARGAATYNRLLEAQGGGCAICAQPECLTDDEGRPMRLSLYYYKGHGSATALLCRACQTGLLWFRDSPEILSRAIQLLLSGRVAMLAPPDTGRLAHQSQARIA